MKINLSRIFTFVFITLSFTGISQIRQAPVTIDQLKEALDYGQNDRIEDKFLNFELEDKIHGFHVSENDLLSSEITTLYPELKAYNLRSVHGARSNGALTIYKGYANLMIRGKKGYEVWSSKPGNATLTKAPYTDEPHLCGLNDKIRKASQITPKNENKVANVIENGDFKRRYRMAIVTTGEFYTMNGNNNGMVTAAVTASVNNLQVIYDRELGVNFQLLNPFLYTNPATDPFTPDNAGGDDRVTQAVNVVTQHFNTNAYDVGHVLNQNVSGDDWTGGGLAYLEAVCDNGFSIEIKAGGWSSSFNANGFQFIQIFAHEVGHMMGAEHTFNGSGGACDDAISETTAYEIGSGTTIMSYDGSCDAAQNIPSQENLDNYFHSHSIVQMINYMNDEGDCAQMITTNNNIPEVDANPCDINWEIPVGTPFYLSGTATDADDDDLTYVWEQYDEDGNGLFTQGLIGNAAGNSPIAPLFRSFPPSPDNFRYFPQMEDLLSGFNDPFEVLPNVFRSMKFRLSVRDNNPSGGAIAQDEITVTVSDTGPFTITSPNGTETLQAGDNINITWNTGGSDALCSMVSIKLSLDGGLTFPIQVTESTSYSSGSFMYALPLGLNDTQDARILITCEDNECYRFFDLSDQGFNINSLCSPDNSSLCDDTPLVADAGDPSLNLNLEHVKSEFFNSSVFQITSTTPSTGVAVNNPSNNGCSVVINNRNSISFMVRVTEDGTYTFNSDCKYETMSINFFSVFENAGFNPSNPCSSFVGSSARQAMAGSNSVFCSGSATVDLEACKEYRIQFWTYDSYPQNVIMESIEGPGLVYFNDITNPDYAYTYIVVDPSDGTIRGSSPTSDFTNLFAGMYHIYGLSYKSGGVTPPMDVDINSLIGSTFIEVAENGNCVLPSTNFKPITIETSCLISEIILGTQTACDPTDNTFTQEVTIVYNEAPTSGMLTVNGTDYPITGSPQIIVLDNLLADGSMIDIEANFTEDQFCANIISDFITAPENCCLIDIPIDDVVALCQGQDGTVNAGTDGISYLWIFGGTALAESSNILTITDAGNYEVVVINSTGCSKRQEFEVVFEMDPTIDIIDDFDLCSGASEEITITTNATEITVFNGSDIFSSGDNVIEITAGGEYSVLVETLAGCSSEESFTVTIIDSPMVDLGDDRVACIGGSVDLFAGVMADAYAWSEMGSSTVLSMTDQLTVTTPGTYVLVATNGGICSGEDEVEVTF